MIKQDDCALSVVCVVVVLPRNQRCNTKFVCVCCWPHLGSGEVGVVRLWHGPQSGDCLQSSPCQHVLCYSGLKVIPQSHHFNTVNIRYRTLSSPPSTWLTSSPSPPTRWCWGACWAALTTCPASRPTVSSSPPQPFSLSDTAWTAWVWRTWCWSSSSSCSGCWSSCCSSTDGVSWLISTHWDTMSCPGKIRSLLPYQPVYSKEMSEKICAAELHLSRSHLYSHCSQDCESTNKVRQPPLLSPLSPLSQDGSPRMRVEPGHRSNVHLAETNQSPLRKTKSAEHLACPRIVISKVRGKPF